MRSEFEPKFGGLRISLMDIKRYCAWALRVSAIAAMGLSDMRCVSTTRGSVNARKCLQFVEDDLLSILEPFDGVSYNSVILMCMYCFFRIVTCLYSGVLEIGLSKQCTGTGLYCHVRGVHCFLVHCDLTAKISATTWLVYYGFQIMLQYIVFKKYGT